MDLNNYNLDDLDLALSEARHQAAVIAGPSSDSRRTAPNTRRGSLVPSATGLSGGAARRKGGSLHERNLFHFGLKHLMHEILLKDGESYVSYHEYAVFSPLDGVSDKEPRSPSIMSEGDEGLCMFRDAVRNGHGLDNEVSLNTSSEIRAGEVVVRATEIRNRPQVRVLIVDRVTLPQIRKGGARYKDECVNARRRICHRPADGIGSVGDGLDLRIDDYETLGLHPATLPGLTRVTSESSFWDAKRESFYLILSFSSNPQPPYDFLSMTYKLRTKTTTALIRRSFDTRWHDEDALDEYERRFDSCRARWAHPLILPIVLLQVQLLRTEEAVIANNGEVLLLEGRVDAVTGTTGQANAEAYKRNGAKSHSRPHHLRPLKRLSSLKEYVEEKVRNGTREHHNSPSGGSPAASLFDPDYIPPQTIYLMKEAHDVLKGSIQLLDTLRWMERAVKLLIQVGDELGARVNELNTKAASKVEPKADDDDDTDDMSFHWHEIRQYLDCIWRLCTSLETDRRMSELRCRAQIDIIYSKMAQEDNNLWRGWWVNQDRYFRRHLSNELSNERYWTIDGKPRDLETTFTQDFFSLFSLSGARSSSNRTILGNRDKTKFDLDDHHSQGAGPGALKPNCALSQTPSVGRDREWLGNQEERLGKSPRFRQISFVTEPRQKPGASIV
ncbi:hypothetical protein FHL15_004493 [Xylaria flabelliformis]|uniref:Uncharacterized protein n=1 Tax=Xylaria flabelliformis TaxID=2512241 RepID=A0A553I3E6_9PEZI|nr:hypothetical protein FHL15_004493 [Xylaria flabelliformis]